MMEGKFKNRWIMAGLIWAGVIIFHFWNIEEIDQIRTIRDQREIFLIDNRFWQDNAEHISQMMQQYSGFTENINSLKLGLLNLENNLRTRALSLGLEKVEFINQPEMSQEGTMPTRLIFQGAFKDALQWLDALRKDFAYVQIQNIKIVLDPTATQAKFQVSIHYRYRLVTAESALELDLMGVRAGRIFSTRQPVRQDCVPADLG